jgi:alcohol dehydrogenase (cytochrome c)
MRSAAAGSSSNTDEIVRVAPPTRKVYAHLPAGANVNISDAMMLNAGSDENDWLLHGRTYDNQRYSPLKQITADNVPMAGRNGRPPRIRRRRTICTSWRWTS